MRYAPPEPGVPTRACPCPRQTKRLCGARRLEKTEPEQTICGWCTWFTEPRVGAPSSCRFLAQQITPRVCAAGPFTVSHVEAHCSRPKAHSSPPFRKEIV
jgi:hypothetical protein